VSSDGLLFSKEHEWAKIDGDVATIGITDYAQNSLGDIVYVEVPRVDYEKLADKRKVEDSATICKRVQAARERQLQRFRGTKLTCNAEMGPAEVRDFCQVDPAAEKLLKAAMQQLHLSARAFHRVLKLSRSIADLAESEMIAANHVAEAIQYRPRMGM